MGSLAHAKRRLEMVILSAPRNLDAVREISIIAGMDNEQVTSFTRQFAPYFKFHNPEIKWNWTLPSENQSECISLDFSDNSTEIIDPTLFPSFHYLAQQIIDMDRKKTLELVSTR